MKKRAMTSFERDRTMSNMRTQLDYQVGPIITAHLLVCASSLVQLDVLIYLL